ncbi:MAG: hypothetical protein H7287_04000 [Thermoleophilia bacterium]|nr:hypothetical protein [Thermoleophilia bacterium]
MLQSIEAPGPGASGSIDASALAASAVAETVIIDAPPLDETPPPSIINSVPPLFAAPQPPDAGAQTTSGFDWSAPPSIADVAIGAALDAVPQTGEAPFSGLPPSATRPAPALADAIVASGAAEASTTPPPTPVAPIDKTAVKAAVKLDAARKRDRIREAKARAKEARAQRKRGDAP